MTKKQIYSEKSVKIYLHILHDINVKCKDNFTVSELSQYLSISRVTMTNFLKGKPPLRLDLMEQVCSIIGMDFELFDYK